jgi:hypothetical protein
MARTTIIDACVTTLQEASKPLAPGEIYRRIIDKELFEFKAKDPLSILRSSIRKHLRGAPPHRLSVVEGGKYVPTAECS